MIAADAWDAFSLWENAHSVAELYGRRCRLEEPEMDCAAQAAEILAKFVSPGDSLLDAGCGSGYFYHSLQKRQMEVDYFGVDGSKTLIAIGQKELPRYGLVEDRLQVIRFEDLLCEEDHVLCMNVLSNIGNYHGALERFFLGARKTVLIRESIWEAPSKYTYVADEFLDPGVRLQVHVNTYNSQELKDFASSYGFSAEIIEDRRAQGGAEMVIGHPHYWKFMLFQRITIC